MKVAILALLTACVPIVAAHGVSYPALAPSTSLSPAPTVMYAKITGGHIVPGVSGDASVAISDDLLSPLAGFACQDTNGDQTCGGPGELALPFCGVGTFQDVANGGSWRPNFALFVFQDSTMTWCGTLGGWTHGFVFHS